ncbi:MAG: immunoglobulin domain-containing protein [Verrucomicrobia bacterium]|nr:immunoglobulin domain-containing protein [Verrucomicrobiota bacterium]
MNKGFSRRFSFSGSAGWFVCFGRAPGSRQNRVLGWLVACWVCVFASVSLRAQPAPAFQWATTGGAAGNETVAGVGTDAAGSVYVAGTFTNTTAFGVFSLTSAGGTDIFLAKYASNGVMQWVRQFGGTGNDVARGIFSTSTGAVFMVGGFEGTVAFGGTNLTSAGGSDAFATRLDAQGNVQWAVSGGGSGDDRAVAVDYGTFGTLLVVGEFSGSATFGGTSGGGTTTLTSFGGQDIFALSLEIGLGTFMNAIGVGGTGDETATSISQGTSFLFNSVIAGNFTGTINFNSAGLPLPMTSLGGRDGFVALWDPRVNRIVSARQIGGPDDDEIQVMTIRLSEVLVAGRFGASLSIPTAPFLPPVSLTNSSASGSDIFSARFSGSGLGTISLGSAGGPGDDSVTGLAADLAGQIYTAGTFSGSFTISGITLNGSGQQDVFIAKHNVGGPFGTIRWARALGGSGNDTGVRLTTDFFNPSAPLLVAGAYEARLTLGAAVLNAVGGSDVFVASIEADPRILTHPQSVAVPFGGTASFSVIAGGTGPFSYQWSHTIPAIGTNPSTTITLANQTNSIMVVNNVTTANVGNYFVQVTGAFGFGRSASAILSLSQSFGITTQPFSRTVTRGSTAVFSVGVSGAGPFSYQWRHNGANILGAVTAVLSVANTWTTDEGVYDVLVSDGITTLTSFSAALFVNSPPFITAEPLSQILPPGSNATLTVVVEGSGPLAFQWRRNGVVIPGATSPTLALTNLSAAEAGAYSLIISNVFASVISGTAVLTVGIPPVINTQPLGQATPVGANVLISVGATGAAPLTYQWFYAGIPIPGAVSATLTLTNTQPANSGTYHAQISDGTITVNTSNILVRVFTPFTLAPPRFTNNSSFSFSLGGDSGQYYRLEFSTNLTSWLPLATNLAIAGEAAFSDTSISNQPGRFYRVSLLP